MDINLRGQSFVLGKNCSVDITAVSSDGFSIVFTADDLLPIGVEFTWFACPSALFGPDEGLPTSDTSGGHVVGHGYNHKKK